MDRGVPNPRFPPLPHFPPPHPPLSLPLAPTSLPLEYFSRPHRKKKQQQQKQAISSYNLSFQCMDYYESFKTVGQFVCSSVHLLVCFLEFYNLVNGPVDNIVVRSSRVRREREKTKENRIDERKNASTAGPCPTITQNNKTARHCN